MLSAKRSSIKWGISDYTTFYRTGGTPAITSMGSGSCVVTTTAIKEGQYLFVWKTEDTTGAISGYFTGIATSSGLSFTYKVLTGTDLVSGTGFTVAMIASNAFFNVPSSDIGTDITLTYSNSSHKITATTITLGLGDLVLIQGCPSGTLLPTVWFIGEVTASDGTYRVLVGTEVAQNTLASTILRSLTPKYCVMNLENLDVEEIVKVEDSQNGQWIPARTTWEIDNAQNNYMNDGSILYYLQDNNQLFCYRGITSTNGVFLINPILHYLTEPKPQTPVQANA